MHLFYTAALQTTRLTLALLIFIFSTQDACAEFIYPDFDRSMLRLDLGLEKMDPDFNSKNRRHYEERNQELISFFRQLYYHNIEEAAKDKNKLGRKEKYKIPRIIHQIWLGGPVPTHFSHWMASWARLKGWEYKLWTDENVKDLSLYNQSLFDQPIPLVEKADILRLELLHQFGGVYVDLDLECMQPEIFEELHRSFDLYIGFEPLEHGFTNKFNIFKVCNAIIGGAPGHPLLNDWVINLKANYLAYQKCCMAVQRTGPSYLTRILCQHERSGAHKKRNMYLPCTFFYPYSEPEMFYLYEHPEMAVILPETAGIHYWCGSWWKKNPFCISNKTHSMYFQK